MAETELLHDDVPMPVNDSCLPFSAWNLLLPEMWLVPIQCAQMSSHAWAALCVFIASYIILCVQHVHT